MIIPYCFKPSLPPNKRKHPNRGSLYIEDAALDEHSFQVLLQTNIKRSSTRRQNVVVIECYQLLQQGSYSCWTAGVIPLSATIGLTLPRTGFWAIFYKDDTFPFFDDCSIFLNEKMLKYTLPQSATANVDNLLAVVCTL
jgi:hypothetical protein